MRKFIRRLAYKDLPEASAKGPFLGERRGRERIGASEGIRTLDIHLGKVTLYRAELRSLPRGPERLSYRFGVGKIPVRSPA
jgi:hypothetical protein